MVSSIVYKDAHTYGHAWLQHRELICLREDEDMLGSVCAHTYGHAWL